MKLAFVFSLMLVMARCSDQSSINAESEQTESLVIRSGTSFGMCMGYCVKDLQIVGTQATFTKRSHIDQTKYPTRTCSKTLTANKVADLASLAKFAEFQKIAETLGCPDCADGGAEYVEIQSGDTSHRVKFEYGKTIPGFEALVKELRAQRELFNDCK